MRTKRGDLPFVREVKEVYSLEKPNVSYHAGVCVLIAPDPMAGKRARYSVICINYKTGTTRCVGRELPLGQSRRVAKRRIKEEKDGKA